MQFGLLWFDNDPQRSTAAKIREAATRYQGKFGGVPNTCYVNAAEQSGSDTVLLPDVLAQVRIVRVGNILPCHFWIGVEAQDGNHDDCELPGTR